MAKFHFSLVAPERELFSGAVDQVDADGVDGDFGVLAGHEPFMTILRPGLVRVRIDQEVLSYRVDGGFVDVTPDTMTLLAENAVEDVARARAESGPLQS
jgi:F-type H+-transporting ATPase subunit epsilon